MQQAGVTPDQIGFIVVGTTTPDTIFPSTACMLQDKIGAHTRWGFDLGAACSGFTYALTTGDADGRDRRARPRRSCVGADVMSSIIDYTDRDDLRAVRRRRRGGGARRRPTKGEPHIIDFAHEIDGSGGPALCMPAGGSRLPASHETVDQRLHYVKQDGQAVFKFAVRKTEEICRRVLERNGIDPTQTRSVRVAPGQPADHHRRRRAARAAGRQGRSSTSSMYGNTTAATIPLALADAVRQRRLKKGDLVLLASVGAGFTVGAVLLRWAISEQEFGDWGLGIKNLSAAKKQQGLGRSGRGRRSTRTPS